MVKPQIIGTVSIKKTPLHETLLRKGSFEQICDNEPCDNDPIFRSLCDLCIQKKFKPVSSSRSNYVPVSYSYGIGSIAPHSDDGMGLTAGLLVATEPIHDENGKHSSFSCSRDCYLFHEHAESLMLKIQIGDVFIFDANYNHAWMANCRWLLALHSIESLQEDQ
jgi:hypothetical protein